MLTKLKKQLTQLRLAIAFMTLLPVAPKEKAEKEDWGRSIKYFTTVGFIFAFLSFAIIKFFTFASLVTGIDFFLDKLWLVALILVLGQIFLSGALHLDGLMDCFDGIGASKETYEESRKIMLDSHIGTFAALAGMITLFAQVIFIKEVLSPENIFLATSFIMLVPVISRSLIVFVIGFQASQALGLKRKASHMFIEFINKPLDCTLSVIMLLFALFLVMWVNDSVAWLTPLIGFILANAALGYLAFTWLGKKLFGHDGDTYGAGLVITETIGYFLLNFYL